MIAMVGGAAFHVGLAVLGLLTLGSLLALRRMTKKKNQEPALRLVPHDFVERPEVAPTADKPQVYLVLDPTLLGDDDDLPTFEDSGDDWSVN